MLIVYDLNTDIYPLYIAIMMGPHQSWRDTSFTCAIWAQQDPSSLKNFWLFWWYDVPSTAHFYGILFQNIIIPICLQESDELGPREDDPPDYKLGLPEEVLAVATARFPQPPLEEWENPPDDHVSSAKHCSSCKIITILSIFVGLHTDAERTKGDKLFWTA